MKIEGRKTIKPEDLILYPEANEIVSEYINKYDVNNVIEKIDTYKNTVDGYDVITMICQYNDGDKKYCSLELIDVVDTVITIGIAVYKLTRAKQLGENK